MLDLTTVLEILAPTHDIGTESNAVLAGARAEAKLRRAALPSDHPELRDVDRLLSRLGKLKTESIKESLRIWTRTTCARMPAWDPQEAASAVAQHYDARSDLVHEGTAPEADIQEALQWLSEFVPAVLTLLIREAAAG